MILCLDGFGISDNKKLYLPTLHAKGTSCNWVSVYCGCRGPEAHSSQDNHQPRAPHEKASSSTRHLQQKGKTDKISASPLALWTSKILYNPGNKATIRELARCVDHFSGLQSGGWEFQRGLPLNIEMTLNFREVINIEEIRAEFIKRGRAETSIF